MDGNDVAQPPDWRLYPTGAAAQTSPQRTGRFGRLRREWLAFTAMTVRPGLILMAVVVPLVLGIILMRLMLGGRPRPSPDKGAQSTLKVTLTDAKAMFGDTGTYAVATASGLSGSEPGYSFVDQQVESKLPKVVSVAATKTTFIAAAKSQTGRCFFIIDSEPAGTRFAETKDRPCAAAEAPGPASALWTEAWPVLVVTD
jgi:hypothetical protein